MSTLLCVCVLCVSSFNWVRSEGVGSGLEAMSLEDLMRQRADLYRDSDTASGTSEDLRDAPASMVVLDSQTIKRRGYDSLDDILFGLPGFDTITTNGTMQTISYQRGYRTPWTQRTLFLIDGRVDNNLWNHSAQLSRQYPMGIIDRVEVLYGPAGAVYGPNAFLGVINVITKDSSSLEDGEFFAEASLFGGSFQTRGVDLVTGGRHGLVSYDFGIRLFESDEAGIEDYSEWGYTDESLLSDPARWGPGIGRGIDPETGVGSPIGDVDVDGVTESGELLNGGRLGTYYDPSENYGVLGKVRIGSWELGMIRWKTDEGYGPYYSFADGQAGVPWLNESHQVYLNNEWKVSEVFSIDTDLVSRKSRVGGDWAESFGDYISLSTWNSESEGDRIEQTYHYKVNAELELSGGLKYEKKRLSKVYMITNYWDGGGVSLAQGPTSTSGVSSDGSAVIPVDEISSLNPTPFFPHVEEDIPDFNISKVEDNGAFVQGILTKGRWRFNAGLRYDHNSEYEDVVNPRGAIIFHQNPRISYKFVYGEAFQEPSPKDLYGGWNGRANNPDLEPEKARNLEFIFIHQMSRFMQEVSVYQASYKNVIAGSQNVGGREVIGFEYKGNVRFKNFLTNASNITGTFYYTYTHSSADRQYNNRTGEWDNQKADTGDIAPHKVNLSLNVPLSQRWNANLTGHWLSSRELFSENPLRADSNPDREQDRKAESYSKFDANIIYETESYRFGVKVENLFESDYLLPGPESASSGDDFSADYDGFQNSLIPQVKKRVYTFTFTLKY